MSCPRALLHMHTCSHSHACTMHACIPQLRFSHTPAKHTRTHTQRDSFLEVSIELTQQSQKMISQQYKLAEDICYVSLSSPYNSVSHKLGSCHAKPCYAVLTYTPVYSLRGPPGCPVHGKKNMPSSIYEVIWDRDFHHHLHRCCKWRWCTHTHKHTQQTHIYTHKWSLWA